MNIATASAIATTGIAVLVGIIKWRQWITNRARLRHELFDRRYAIYEQIAGFVATVIQNGTITTGAEINFLRQTKCAHFTFGGDKAVKQLVGDIYKRGVLLQTLQSRQKTLPIGDARNRNVDEQGEVLRWFRTTLSSLEQLFEKYLNLEH